MLVAVDLALIRLDAGSVGGATIPLKPKAPISHGKGGLGLR